MSNIRRLIAQAKDYYFNHWRGHENICPAFKEKVYVTRLAWNHICYHPRRLLTDKIIRLKKLSLAKELLDSATSYQTIQKQGQFILYGFRAIKADTVVKVVVSEKENSKRKELYSVMFKILKHQQQYKLNKKNDNLIRKFRRENPRPIIRRRK